MTQIKDIIKGYDLLIKNELNVEVYNDKRSCPEYLYKYYNIVEYNFKAFEDNKFYGLSYVEFNDPFEQLFKFYYPKIPKKKMDAFNGFFGTICFTESCKNMLMWSYYTALEGYVLEFSRKKLILEETHKKFITPNPIIYIKSVKDIDNNKLKSINNPVLIALVLSYIKFKKWKHEKEWRIIGYDENSIMNLPGMSNDERDKTDDRFFRYNPDSIHAIYLGPKFFGLFEKKEQNGDRIILSCNVKNKSRYLPSMNEKINIKKKILKLIQERELPCYIMEFDLSNFKLFPKRVDIRGDDGEYEIKKHFT